MKSRLPDGFVDTCRAIIGIDSSPSAGSLEIAEFAKDLAERLGLAAELQRDSWKGVDQANVLIRPRGLTASGVGEKSEFILETHLDTPDPGAYSLWEKNDQNPFSASIYLNDGQTFDGQTASGDIIYGLGAADVKLDFLCKLYAISDIARELRQEGGSWKKYPVLAGTFGEELGMAGAIRLIRKKKIDPFAILVGEPTNLRPVIAGKGFASVEIEVPFSDAEKQLRDQHLRGESVLSQSRIFSRGKEPDGNAIQKLFEALEKLPSNISILEIEGGVNFNTPAAQAVLEIDTASTLAREDLPHLIAQKLIRIRAAIRKVEERFELFPDEEFAPAVATINIGIVRTYEDFVKLVGCVRLPPTVKNEEYEEWMSVLRDACEKEDGSFRIGDYKAPFRCDIESPFLKTIDEVLVKLGINAPHSTQVVANEANVFTKFGIETMVWGPGQGVGNSHTPHECVKLADLAIAIEFYREMIKRMCL